MNETQSAPIARWVTAAGLAGKHETQMLTGFSERILAAGVPLARSLVVIDTLHPIHEGRVFRWRREGGAATEAEYGRTTEGPAAEAWRRSPFYRMLQTGAATLRLRVNTETAEEYPSIKDFLGEGMTDYLAILNRFAASGIIGEMDCVYSSWITDAPQGFSDGDVGALERLMPYLALAIKCASLARIAETLVGTYLGRDPAQRVLSGRIARGVADRIGTVLWFSDLRGYTKITDTAAPEQVIPLLNDYAEAVISSINSAGGDVLKLIGDGILAIFPAEDRGRACISALGAALSARQGIVALNSRRIGENLPVKEMYLGLHVGEVFYGNIGSKERLDFTVIGPAVNEVSRIAAMCRSVDQPLLASAAFADALGAERSRLVSVGRYALRGVGRPQELFTLDPGIEAP
ncbi:MAG TPA: adenylate/guanylate cyclase domain-containing protein [Stellaceae bacterium]|nr:adenylate/guanylate cyclase domain-containing protein [Stellaceae bacterium]